MEKVLLVYSMKGCPHCTEFKKMLENENIDFLDRDIDEHQEEYDLFTQLTNDLVPAFMIVESETERAEYFAPDIDFQELEEALSIVKEKM